MVQIPELEPAKLAASSVKMLLSRNPEIDSMSDSGDDVVS